MPLRWLLFLGFAGFHALSVLASVESLAPAMAGSVYLPLLLFEAVGVPVFAAPESGGWGAPTLLGWALVCLVWASVWWGVALLLARLGSKRT